MSPQRMESSDWIWAKCRPSLCRMFWADSPKLIWTWLPAPTSPSSWPLRPGLKFSFLTSQTMQCFYQLELVLRPQRRRAWSSWSCGRWWWGAGWGCRRWGWCPAVFWYKILVIFRCFPLEYAFEDQNNYYLFKLFENLSREGFQFDFGKVYSLEPPLPPFVFFLKKIKKTTLKTFRARPPPQRCHPCQDSYLFACNKRMAWSGEWINTLGWKPPRKLHWGARYSNKALHRLLKL